MKSDSGRIMRGIVIRALCVAGVFAVSANGARAGSVAGQATGEPLDLTAYETTLDQGASAPGARLAGEFELGLPDTLPGLSYGPPEFAPPGPYGAVGHLKVLDGVSFDFGADVDLARQFNPFDAAASSAYDGLFFSASSVNSPYASLASGGSFFGSSVTFADGLRFSLGEASVSPGMNGYETSAAATVARLGGMPRPYDLRSANSLLTGVSWKFAPWGGVGLTASQTAERDGLLGIFSPTTQAAGTSALGVSARLQLGAGWMTTASFAEAITKLDLKPGLGATPDDLHTRSYGFAVAKRGLFGNDAMGLAVTRPAPGGMANSEFALISGMDARPQYFAGNRLLPGQGSETDFEVGYVTTFLDGSVALQANAAYQVNFAGQSGNNAVSLLSRAKIKF